VKGLEKMTNRKIFDMGRNIHKTTTLEKADYSIHSIDICENEFAKSYTAYCLVDFQEDGSFKIAFQKDDTDD
jgi:hypothetical protein